MAKLRSQDSDRPLPNDAQAERAVLGTVLLQHTVAESVAAILNPADFFDSRNQRIFRAMLAMNAARTAIDEITLNDYLQEQDALESAGGIAHIAALADGLPSVTNVRFYSDIVREKSIARRLINLAHDIEQDALNSRNPNALISKLVVESTNLAQSLLPRANWRERFHLIDELPEGEPMMLIDGILPEGITFVGAASAVGKTWFALSIAKAVTTGEKFLGLWFVPAARHVLYLCPEMNAKAFKRRCRRFGISGERFRCMTISDGAPLDLSDPLLSAAIRELQPVTFLDTAIRFSSAESENSSSDNAQGLAPSIFALLHAGAPAVVCLHHRSKEATRAEEMTLENVLRGTGDLGAMADCVIGLQHDRGDGTAGYIAESKTLVRLSVRCVKSRDFRPREDFRIQLDPYIDQAGDFGVLTDELEGSRQSESDILSAAIDEDPKRDKALLQMLTGIGKNRQERLAAERGWLYDRKTKWTRSNA